MLVNACKGKSIDELKVALRLGGLELANETLDKLVWQPSTENFCRCGEFMVWGPGLIGMCPAARCGKFLAAPEGHFLSKCTHCLLGMGPGAKVKNSDLNLGGADNLASLTTSTRAAFYEYFRYYGGEVDMQVNGERGYAKTQADLFKYMA